MAKNVKFFAWAELVQNKGWRKKKGAIEAEMEAPTEPNSMASNSSRMI